MAYISLGNTSSQTYDATIYFEVSYEEFGTSVTANTNKVRVKLVAHISPTGYYRTCNLSKSSVTINSIAYALNSSSAKIYNASGTELSSITQWYNGYSAIITSDAIVHNTDGNKTIDISTSNNIGGVSGRCTLTKNVNLTTIARTAGIKASKNTVAASGESVTFTLSPYSTSFNYTLEYKLGSGSYTQFSPSIGSDGKFTWNTPSSASSTTLTVRCTTKSGSTQVGSPQTVSINVVKQSASMPLSLYDNKAGSVGASIGREATGPGFYVNGVGPFTFKTITVNGVSYQVLAL